MIYLMPFRSRKQEKWMWANHPRMARRWADKYGGTKSRKRRRRRK